MIVKAKVGDTVWIHGVVSEGNPLWPAKVEHVFHLYGMEQYVVSVETHVEPVLHVRDGFSISDDPNKPIGLFRRGNVD